MYQQSKRLKVTRNGRGFSVFDIAVKRASSLLAAINALSLLDKRQAWLAISSPSSRVSFPSSDLPGLIYRV